MAQRVAAEPAPVGEQRADIGEVLGHTVVRRAQRPRIGLAHAEARLRRDLVDQRPRYFSGEFNREPPGDATALRPRPRPARP